MGFARFVLRLLVGSLFVGHGLQKLEGWFGGAGIEQTGEFFESLGLRPGRRHALAAGAAEAGGGALLALGLATPLAAASLIAVMSTAIRKVHAQNGPWVADGGFEYNAVLVGALTLLAEAGPGRLSLDAALGTEKKGIGYGLAALGGGVLASEILLRTAGDSRERSADTEQGAEVEESVAAPA